MVPLSQNKKITVEGRCLFFFFLLKVDFFGLSTNKTHKSFEKFKHNRKIQRILKLHP